MNNSIEISCAGNLEITPSSIFLDCTTNFSTFELVIPEDNIYQEDRVLDLDLSYLGDDPNVALQNSQIRVTIEDINGKLQGCEVHKLLDWLIRCTS